MKERNEMMNALYIFSLKILLHDLTDFSKQTFDLLQKSFVAL